ncbi:MAG: aminotransferase class I/II-fold pyridoxal phosphate-dependent enzyme [Ruthenibacterium lactatiformans]
MQAVDVMRNAEGQTQGKYLEKFEGLRRIRGCEVCLGVNNCTNALKLAAIFCHIQPGDEVIVPAYTYCASAIPFGDLRRTYRLGRHQSGTWTIDPDDFERKITPRPRLWWPFTCWASPAT